MISCVQAQKFADRNAGFEVQWNGKPG